MNTAELRAPVCRLSPITTGGAPVKFLVRDNAGQPAERYQFASQLEIGRDEPGRDLPPGLLLVRDPSVSFRHCAITQTAEGVCYVRDLSRNGTLLNGRRLMPNAEAEFKVGQTLTFGHGLSFVLHGEPATAAPTTAGRTEMEPKLTLATVLVGDIHDYTVMVRKAPASVLQQSVSRVFEVLTASVEAQGGTVKEFPGDAILAFWEGNYRGQMALAASRAAITLNQVARRIADDPAIWTLREFPLRMDWALATGQVSIEAFSGGGGTPMGLSMVGEPIVLACRIEKFANDQTGPILACRVTRDMVRRAQANEGGAPLLDFVDLGEMQAKGFDKPDHVFSIRVPDD